MIDQFLKVLGMPVRDRVTGFSGVATSVCFDLYGCVQVWVAPVADATGKLGEGGWFDEKRIETTADAPVLTQPTFASVPGPAAKGAPPSGPR